MSPTPSSCSHLSILSFSACLASLAGSAVMKTRSSLAPSRERCRLHLMRSPASVSAESTASTRARPSASLLASAAKRSSHEGACSTRARATLDQPRIPPPPLAGRERGHWAERGEREREGGTGRGGRESERAREGGSEGERRRACNYALLSTLPELLILVLSCLIRASPSIFLLRW
eukprot:scaffold6871_cov29-Tisochrysis_lutea.AAC.7